MAALSHLGMPTPRAGTVDLRSGMAIFTCTAVTPVWVLPSSWLGPATAGWFTPGRFTDTQRSDTGIPSHPANCLKRVAGSGRRDEQGLST